MSAAYSSTYAEAREKFLALASSRGAPVISRVHPTARGAQDEELAIDIAVFGDPDAEKTLFLVSGTHGQEGFYGSALQIEYLRDLEIPEGANVVALHARSEEHTSELQSLMRISYAVFCLKTKTKHTHKYI